jgi:inward rectifier potassium channel
MRVLATRIRPTGAAYEIRIVGDRRRPLRDLYHALLRLSWPATIATIAGWFLLANAVFAAGYHTVGGVAHLSPDSFADAFFFSVQTMGTVGYGAMYPESFSANVLVVAETIVGLTLMALVTGLVFAKFSRPTARIVFTREAVISPMNGVPSLMFRIGNERGNSIVDTQFRAVVTRTEQTAEGGTFYRLIDLKLVRDRALSLSRSLSIIHTIDAGSPLYGLGPRDLAEQEAEIELMAVGLDDTSMQVVHARHRYYANQIVWGARHVDIIAEGEDGSMLVDLRKFHLTEPTTPIDGFPYPG